MHRNYRRVAANLNYYKYFVIFSFPIFGYVLSLCERVLIFFNKVKLLNSLSKNIISFSSLRFFSHSDRKYLNDNLSSYNTGAGRFAEDQLQNEGSSIQLDSLRKNGYCWLGNYFSEETCGKFVHHLRHKLCFNSQVPMQSNGKPFFFNPSIISGNITPHNYYAFLPETTLSFEPIRSFLYSKYLTNMVTAYLNFTPQIYSCITWFNPATNLAHYVHRLHRDYDDYKFVGLIIYWNEVTKDNGATAYVPGSHRGYYGNQRVLLTAKAGDVFLVDFSGLHMGLKVTEGHRYTTFVRWGAIVNHATIMDGFVTTPGYLQSQSAKSAEDA